MTSTDNIIRRVMSPSSRYQGDYPIELSTEKIVALSFNVVKLVVTAGITYYVTNKMISVLKSALDPSAGSDASILSIKKALAKRLKRPEIEVMEMSAYEAKISGDVVSCDEITTSFNDIGKAICSLAENIWKHYK